MLGCDHAALQDAIPQQTDDTTTNRILNRTIRRKFKNRADATEMKAILSRRLIDDDRNPVVVARPFAEQKPRVLALLICLREFVVDGGEVKTAALDQCVGDAEHLWLRRLIQIQATRIVAGLIADRKGLDRRELFALRLREVEIDLAGVGVQVGQDRRVATTQQRKAAGAARLLQVRAGRGEAERADRDDQECGRGDQCDRQRAAPRIAPGVANGERRHAARTLCDERAELRRGQRASRDNNQRS